MHRKDLKEMFHDPNLDYDAIRAYRKKIMEEALQKNGIELKSTIELLEFLKKRLGRLQQQRMKNVLRYLSKLDCIHILIKIICDNGKIA